MTKLFIYLFECAVVFSREPAGVELSFEGMSIYRSDKVRKLPLVKATTGWKLH